MHTRLGAAPPSCTPACPAPEASACGLLRPAAPPVCQRALLNITPNGCPQSCARATTSLRWPLHRPWRPCPAGTPARLAATSAPRRWCEQAAPQSALRVALLMSKAVLRRPRRSGHSSLTGRHSAAVADAGAVAHVAAAARALQNPRSLKRRRSFVLRAVCRGRVPLRRHFRACQIHRVFFVAALVRSFHPADRYGLTSSLTDSSSHACTRKSHPSFDLTISGCRQSPHGPPPPPVAPP